MQIRLANISDIDSLMLIFDKAKKIMHACGNIRQWSDSYPSRELVYRDINAGACVVLCQGNEIIATMSLIPGPEPTYSYIEGSWPDQSPYYVIHRIASAVPGMNSSKFLLDWAFNFIASRKVSVIRIDTHRDNVIMKHILDKYGFNLCGVIYLNDGSSRDAYYLKK